MRTLLLLLSACTATAVPDDLDSDSVPVTPAGPLRVLSYNVHGLPDPITAADHTLNGAERMARIAPLLTGFDLVGLQEDWQPETHAILVDGAEQPDMRWFDTRVAADRAYGAGVTVLADLGVVSDYTETWYDTCYGLLDGASDCFASKGFQALTLDLGDGAVLTWLNTHHEAGGGEADAVSRTAQVTQVLAFLDALPDGHAVLYTGDFNLHGDDPTDVAELTRYEAAGLRNACHEVDCAEPDRIDIVYVRDSAGMSLVVDDWQVDTRFVDEADEALSDHDAIAVGLTWARP